MGALLLKLQPARSLVFHLKPYQKGPSSLQYLLLGLLN